MYICRGGGRKSRVGLAEAGEAVFAVLAPGAVAGSGARPVLPPLVRRYRGRVSGPQRVDVIIVHGRRPRGVVRREAKDVDRGSRRGAPPRPGAAPPAGTLAPHPVDALGPFTTLPAHDADATLHRAPAMSAHTRTRTLLSLTRDRYIHTNYKLPLFRTCAGSTFVWARRMRRGGDGGNTMTVSARGRTTVMADSEPRVWCSGGEAGDK